MAKLTSPEMWCWECFGILILYDFCKTWLSLVSAAQSGHTYSDANNIPA